MTLNRNFYSAWLGALLLATLVANGDGALAAERPGAPRLPYVNVGACPGEACYYNVEFIANEDTVARRGHGTNDGVAYPVRKGQRLFGTNGVIVTHKPGVQRATRDCTVGDLALKRGDVIYDLYYVGIGHNKALYKGSTITYEQFSVAEGCLLAEEQKLDSRWWVQAEDEQGRKGWIEGERFIHQGKYSTDEELHATWISLRPGEEKLRIRYARDGSLYYNGKPAARLSSIGVGKVPGRVLVSTIPPFFVLGCEEAKGREYCWDLYHVNEYAQRAIPVCTPGNSAGKCHSHSNHDFLILHHEGLGFSNGDGRLYRINVRTGEAARIPINLAKYPSHQFIDMRSFKWSEDGRGFTVFAYVRCEGMSDQKCDQRLGRPRRVAVDINSLAVQVSDPK